MIYIDLKKFYFIGPVITLGIVVSIPVLFAAGNRLFVHVKKANRRDIRDEIEKYERPKGGE